jgi:arsenite methyltransferase
MLNKYLMTNPNENSEYHMNTTGHTMSSYDWLDIHFLAMQPEYEDMLRWVGIQPDWHVLDAACGGGSFLPLMTELVGRKGKISAMDIDPKNIEAIDGRAKKSNWFAVVFACIGTMLELPCENQSFDAVWCANTSQYLTDDEVHQMLKEFRRVTRPAGLIAIKDYDAAGQQFQSCSPTLVSQLNEGLARAGNIQPHGILRVIQLSAWLRAAGLVEIRQKPTLMLRFQPLKPVEKAFLRDFIKFFCKQAQTIDLSAEELRIWEQLADVDSPEHILNHPDFQYRAIQTVFTGRVPKG